jgi:hypothetical protein
MGMGGMGMMFGKGRGGFGGKFTPGGRPGGRPPFGGGGMIGPGPGGMGGFGGPGGFGGASGDDSVVSGDDNDRNVELVVYGIISLYERYPPKPASDTPAPAPAPK